MCRILKTHQKPLDRQISKAISIKMSLREGVHLLNNRNEYNRCILPELFIERGMNKKAEEKLEDSELQSWTEQGRKLEEDDKTSAEPGNNKKKTWHNEHQNRKRKYKCETTDHEKDSKTQERIYTTTQQKAKL